MSEAEHVRVGEHLRRLRKQRGLSLLDVESASSGEFKASVLGAYERGERAISAGRLVRLGRLYDLPPQAMMPVDRVREPGGDSSAAIDLTRLEELETSEARTLIRYLEQIRAQRGDWTARVVRIRAIDVRVLASALDRSPVEFNALLDEMGIRAY